MGVSRYEKQGILEDIDSDCRDGADGTDNHTGSERLHSVIRNAKLRK
jgi:hypothetical protein